MNFKGGRMDRGKIAFGKHLKRTRVSVGLTQQALARAAKLSRLRLVRLENGLIRPGLDEVVRLAGALKVPLQWLTTGQWEPAADLRGIAIELARMGVSDLEVADPDVPGAFRPPEQIVVLALRGDRPEPRVVEAIPVVLALNSLNVPLTVAFADRYDPRVRTRLAWLSDVTLTLHRLSSFPLEVKREEQLGEFIRAAEKAREPDSLGHPREGKGPPIWLRWNITYAGDLQTFLARAREIKETGPRAPGLETAS
jgi:transcriptional regulator with XRE-family HTH domain